MPTKRYRGIKREQDAALRLRQGLPETPAIWIATAAFATETGGLVINKKRTSRLYRKNWPYAVSI